MVKPILFFSINFANSQADMAEIHFWFADDKADFPFSDMDLSCSVLTQIQICVSKRRSVN
jgi:hypothetical protein